MTPLISSSQIILEHNSTRYHCYTDIENRIIGRTILNKLQSDTLITFYKKELVVKNQIITLKDSSIMFKDTIIKSQVNIIKDKDKQIKKTKCVHTSINIGLLIGFITILLL